jgi:hypothetical protein
MKQVKKTSEFLENKLLSNRIKAKQFWTSLDQICWILLFMFVFVLSNIFDCLQFRKWLGNLLVLRRNCVTFFLLCLAKVMMMKLAKMKNIRKWFPYLNKYQISYWKILLYRIIVLLEVSLPHNNNKYHPANWSYSKKNIYFIVLSFCLKFPFPIIITNIFQKTEVIPKKSEALVRRENFLTFNILQTKFGFWMDGTLSFSNLKILSM